MSTSTTLVTGVDFAILPTKDFDRAVDFYENVLGLEKSKQWGEMPAQEFETGNLTIAVVQMDAFGQEFSAHKSPIAFRVDDVAAAREEALPYGSRVRNPPGTSSTSITATRRRVRRPAPSCGDPRP